MVKDALAFAEKTSLPVNYCRALKKLSQLSEKPRAIHPEYGGDGPVW
ncbi:hypothetical protein EDF68_105161 [Ochrobactrum sp. BH3]|nr:hypothetical protein EDF68_105161 [Ochrobactrum sp. BH3]